MKRFAKSIFALGIAVLAFAACEKKQEPVEEPVKYTLSGDAQFNENLKALVKVTADKAAKADVAVIIKAETNFPTGSITYDEQINVKQGDKEAQGEVVITNPDLLEFETTYKIELTATVEKTALDGKVTLTYTTGKAPVIPVTGDAAWSVIGNLYGDSNWTIDYSATALAEDVFVVKNVEINANNEFKWRKDKKWDVNFGGTFEEAGKAFTVVQDGANIKSIPDGVYDLYLNTTTAEAAVVAKDGDVPTWRVLVPALEKVWEWKSTADALWTANVTAISITHPDGYGMARGLTMDDEYIYLPKSSAYAAIAAIKITDPTTQVKGNVSGVDAGELFKSSFVRMIKNTDPAVNGGKDVLLMSNLGAANGGNIVIYAYNNGIEAAPIKLAQFAWDSANNVEDWRRYGDRFFVTGTWQDGKIYLPSYNENKIVALGVANGTRSSVEQYAAGTNSPNGIKDLTVYPGGKKLFLSNISIANLVSATGNKSAQGWDEYVLDKASAKGVGTYGYNFFEFDGKKYMAYARATEQSAQIEVIEDQGTEDNFVASIDAQAGLLSAAIQTEGFASGNTADCCVREIDGVVYIAALSRDGGLALYKLIKK